MAILNGLTCVLEKNHSKKTEARSTNLSECLMIIVRSTGQSNGLITNLTNCTDNSGCDDSTKIVDLYGAM